MHITPNYLCMNLKSFRRTKYCLNVNNCSGEEMSSPCNAVSDNSSLLHPSVAVTLPKLNIMSKKLLRKESRKCKSRKIQSIFSVLNYRFTNLDAPYCRCFLIHYTWTTVNYLLHKDKIVTLTQKKKMMWDDVSI